MFQNHRDNFRNHVSRPTDDNGIPYSHIQTLNLRRVMQRRIRHRDATDENGIQSRDGSQSAGATYLDFNGFDDRRLLLRRKLVRHRPSGRSGHRPQDLLIINTADLVDDAVNLVFEAVTQCQNLLVILQARVKSLDLTRQWVDGQAELAQLLKHLHLGPRLITALPGTYRIAEKGQRSLRTDLRIELSQAPGRGVTGVGVQFFIARLLLFVQHLKPRHRHEDFAAHIEHPGRTAWA